jgi:hypothetical protein
MMRLRYSIWARLVVVVAVVAVAAFYVVRH